MSTQNKDGPCAFCNELTNSVAGNPGRWPLFFTHPDGTGKVKPHHMQCVQDRVFGRLSAMREVRWTPAWRHAKHEIVLVANPTKAWFDGLEHARFSIMGDGEIWWGDSRSVVHGDIIRFRAEENVEPFLVGVFMRIGGVWTVPAVQNFLHKETTATENARVLCSRLTSWVETEKRLGEPVRWGAPGVV